MCPMTSDDSEKQPETTGESAVLLEAVGLVKRYGGVEALRGVNFQVRAGRSSH